MKHGPFYKSDQLVAAVHKAAGGIFAGFRAAHAYGRLYAGTFTATPAAKTLSRAAHFQGTPVPVTARLSGSSSDPAKAPVNVAAIATKSESPAIGCGSRRSSFALQTAATYGPKRMTAHWTTSSPSRTRLRELSCRRLRFG
jgi:hypothetical protein